MTPRPPPPGRWYPFLRCPYGNPELLRAAAHAYRGTGCLFVHPGSEAEARGADPALPRATETYEDMPRDRFIVIGKDGEVSERTLEPAP